MKLPIHFGVKTKCVFASFTLLLTHPVAFSSPVGTKSVCTVSLNEAHADVTKTERGNTLVYSFHLNTVPDADLLSSSLERFRQIEGFVSLSVNSRNEVELVTKSTISERDNTRLLAASTRLYGYNGYQIS